MFVVLRSAVALALGALLISLIGLTGARPQPVHATAVGPGTTVSAAEMQAAVRTQGSWQTTMQQTQTQIVAEQQRQIAAQQAAAAAAAAAQAAAAQAAAQQAAAQQAAAQRAAAQAAAQRAAQQRAAQQQQQAQQQAAAPPPAPQPAAPAPTPRPAPAAQAPAAPAAPAPAGSIQQIITAAFSPQGSAAVSWGLAVARCESGDNPRAVNAGSGAEGLFQFMPSTFAGTPEGRAGESIFDATASADAAAWMYSQGRQGEWSCNP